MEGALSRQAIRLLTLAEQRSFAAVFTEPNSLNPRDWADSFVPTNWRERLSCLLESIPR